MKECIKNVTEDGDGNGRLARVLDLYYPSRHLVLYCRTCSTRCDETELVHTGE